jgi:hypothetical protein
VGEKNIRGNSHSTEFGADHLNRFATDLRVRKLLTIGESAWDRGRCQPTKDLTERGQLVLRDVLDE